jgi:SAM-dependent methyltransferase
MPDEAFWETLFNVPLILEHLEITHRLRDVVELGCGYGTFTLPVASRIAGTLHTFDIDQKMVRRTAARAAEAGIKNLRCERRDVFVEGFGVPDASQDGCLLFNILHCEEPVRILTEAARVLRAGGVVMVVHWRHDPATPRGPALDIRPRPDQIGVWASATGGLERVPGVVDLAPWHFGLRFRKG